MNEYFFPSFPSHPFLPFSAFEHFAPTSCTRAGKSALAQWAWAGHCWSIQGVWKCLLQTSRACIGDWVDNFWIWTPLSGNVPFSCCRYNKFKVSVKSPASAKDKGDSNLTIYDSVNYIYTNKYSLISLVWVETLKWRNEISLTFVT